MENNNIIGKFIKIVLLLFSSLIYAQNTDLPKDSGVYKVIQIDSLGKYYLIKAINDDGKSILILEQSPKKKMYRKIKKKLNAHKIKLNEQYFFGLENKTYDIGFSQTDEIAIGETIIWERGKSDYNVYSTSYLGGLYYISQNEFD